MSDFNEWVAEDIEPTTSRLRGHQATIKLTTMAEHPSNVSSFGSNMMMMTLGPDFFHISPVFNYPMDDLVS